MAGGKEAKYLRRGARRMPVGVIHGARPGGRITVLGGQHGTEYAGIEAVQRLYRTLDPADVSGTIVIGLAVNEESLFDWTQFAPTTPDINSMMLEAAEGSEYLVNCHGGEFTEAMCPYVICRLIGSDEADRRAMRMATVFGLGIVSVSRYRGEPPPNPDGTRPAWWLWPRKSLGDELRIPEITPEFGERGSREDGPMHDGIVNVLRDLDFLPGDPPEVPPARVIGERYWLTALETGMFFPEVSICEYVSKGQRLGVVRDFFGSVLQVVESPADARVMNMNVGMPVKKDAFLFWLGEV